MEAYNKSEGTTPLIFNPGTRYSEVNNTPWPLYSHRNIPQYPLTRKLSGL